MVYFKKFYSWIVNITKFNNYKRRMDKSGLNIQKAGELFMYCVWLQGQMSDLIILKKNPEYIQGFIDNPSKIPESIYKQRVKYWEKNSIKLKRNSNKSSLIC